MAKPDEFGDPHRAEILVEWWPSASVGELETTRSLLKMWCSQMMEHLQFMGLVDVTVELDLSGAAGLDTTEEPDADD